MKAAAISPEVLFSASVTAFVIVSTSWLDKFIFGIMDSLGLERDRTKPYPF
jgi:hypothetical protein